MHEGAGAKADNLIKLYQAGFDVPQFYVVYHEKLDQTAKLRLRSEFEDWRQRTGVLAVAVRSSAEGEDSKDASFAGQYETVLDITTPDSYVEAIEEVFASKPSEGYAKGAGPVHAVVQEFVEPRVAGVMFTINPATGENQLVINAAPGRGTKVVEGKEAEQYLVDRFDPDPRHYGELRNLSAAQVKELTKLGLEIEEFFDGPQDIEWAIKGDQIYVLQSRPITAINHLRLWDSSNIAESFPGIVMPLTFSIAKKGYLAGYKSQAYAAGHTWYELEENNRTLDSMIGLFNGRMYYNLLSWYKFISLFPGSKRNQQFLDDQIATQGEAIYQPPAKLARWFKFKFYTRVVYRTIFFNLELKRFYARFAQFEETMNRMPKGGDSQLLMIQYSQIEQTIIPHFGRTIDNDFFVMTYHGWLKRLLTKWLPPKLLERSSLIGTVNRVMSAEQAVALYDLADSFKKDRAVLEDLKQGDFQGLDNKLEGTAVKKAIDSYIAKFGHRFAEDQKIEAENPTLSPNGMYKLLQAYVQLDSDQVRKRLSSTDARTASSEKEIEKRLSPLKRAVYKWLRARLKHHLRIREKNRLLRGRIWGYMRTLFPKVGGALAEEAVISEPRDVFYLQIDEIYQLMQGSLIVNDLRDRIQKRKAGYSTFEAIPMPERFITTSLPSLEEVRAIENRYELRPQKSLPGLVSSPGTVEGKAIVLTKPSIPEEPFDILIASHTDPGWTPLIALAKGVIVEHGGMLSHAAIVTRELGIPSIIGVENVTKLVKSGAKVRINTQTSSVELL